MVDQQHRRAAGQQQLRARGKQVVGARHDDSARQRVTVAAAFDDQRRRGTPHLEVEHRRVTHILRRTIDDAAAHAFDGAALSVDGLDRDLLRRLAGEGRAATGQGDQGSGGKSAEREKTHQVRDSGSRAGECDRQYRSGHAGTVGHKDYPQPAYGCGLPLLPGPRRRQGNPSCPLGGLIPVNEGRGPGP